MRAMRTCTEPSAEASDNKDTLEWLHGMKSILSNNIPSLLISLSVFLSLLGILSRVEMMLRTFL